MADAAAAGPKVRIARLEFRARNLAGKRRAAMARLGETLFGKCRTLATDPRFAADFREAGEHSAAIARLEEEDATLAASSQEVSRGARLAHSLARAKERGATYAGMVRADSRLKSLERDRTALLARLGRTLFERHAEARVELAADVTRMLAEVDAFDCELAVVAAESGAIQAASAAMDPRMRRRLYWIAGALAAALLALAWWIALSVLF